MIPYSQQTPQQRKRSLKIVGMAILLAIPYLSFGIWMGLEHWIINLRWLLFGIFLGYLVFGTLILKMFVKKIDRATPPEP